MLATNAAVSPTALRKSAPRPVTSTIDPVSVIELSASAERASPVGTTSVSSTLYVGRATTRSRLAKTTQT